MEQATTRDVLDELAASPTVRTSAASPIGSPELQEEADRKAYKGEKPSPALKQTIKRTAKIWLPQGKKAARAGGACNEPDAKQIDIEDAVEAAGGKRGGR